MPSAFTLFGRAHLAALVLTLAAPLVLALLARRRPALDRPIRLVLAALLSAGWLGWYALFELRGWLTLSNMLPLNLCDWAAAALIVALLTRNPAAYALGYFWGLGGTVQGLITPDIAYGFPDAQFVLFFLNHGGIVAALLYLTWGSGLRPRPRQFPGVVAATLGYAALAGAADGLLGTNYAFLRAKPANVSLLQFLAPWPWYIPELVALGLASLAIYYAPFLVLDLSRTYRATARLSPSRTR